MTTDTKPAKTPAELIEELATRLHDYACVHKFPIEDWCKPCLVERLTALLDELLAPLAEDNWLVASGELRRRFLALADYARARAGKGKA